MKQFFPFPSINQFRNVVTDVKHRNAYVGMDEAGCPVMDRNKKAPMLKFSGTVKLHGTNAAVCCYKSDMWCQSRNDIITVGHDNAGFAAFINEIEADHTSMNMLFNSVVSVTADTEYMVDNNNDAIAIFGEWCGGSIQKGVAITGLPKMFVIFKIKVIKDGDAEKAKWLPPELVSLIHNKEKNIFNIYDFKTYEQLIDFDNPQMVQNQLVEHTQAVELQCPVGLSFGNDGVGEGIVWTCVTPSSEVGFITDDLIFKVKGEKHSVSKVKKLAEVNIEKLNSVAEFVDMVITENRLNQGLQHLEMNGLELDMKNMGSFLKWVANDVFKEESDTMIGNGLNQKDVGGALAKKARFWFAEKIKTF